MKQYKTAKQAMQQKENKKIILFQPIQQCKQQVMRPGKTAKDRAKRARA